MFFGGNGGKDSEKKCNFADDIPIEWSIKCLGWSCRGYRGYVQERFRSLMQY